MLTSALLLALLQAPPAPADPLLEPSTFESWATTEFLWTPGAPQRALIGGLAQGQLGFGRLAAAFSAKAGGLPGEFVPGQIQTFRVVEAQFALSLNLAHLTAGDITLGPAIAAGAAIWLDTQNGQRPDTPKQATAILGLRLKGRGWWAYGGLGQDQALRGLCATVKWWARVAGSEPGKKGELANYGLASIGSRTWRAETGGAVRLK